MAVYFRVTSHSYFVIWKPSRPLFWFLADHKRQRCISSSSNVKSAMLLNTKSNEELKKSHYPDTNPKKKKISPQQLALALQKRRREAREEKTATKDEGKEKVDKEKPKQKSEKIKVEKIHKEKSNRNKRNTAENLNRKTLSEDKDKFDTVSNNKQRTNENFKLLNEDKTDEEDNDSKLVMRYKIYKPEQEKLVTHLQSKLGDNVKFDPSPFKGLTTAPSVIGISFSDIDNRIVQLTESGFSMSDVGQIIPFLPFCVDIDCKKLREMCLMLEEFDIRWEHFLTKEHCSCLFQSSADVVRNNLEGLKKLGLKGVNLKNLLKTFPILFVCPLKSEAVEALLDTSDEGFSTQWIESTLADSLSYRPVKVTVGNCTKELAKILKKFTINPNFVMRKYPNFFQMQATNLYSILKVMSGPPLYLDTALISSIITSSPHDVLSITDHNILRKHLMEIKELLLPVLSVQAIGAHLNRVPSLINPNNSIRERVSLLEDKGFTRDEVCRVAGAVPSLLVQESDVLKKRLSLLLGLNESTPAAVASATSESALFMIRRIEDVISRYNYAKKHNESLLHIANVHKLFGSTDIQFASLFDQTAIHYLSEASSSQWIDSKLASHRISLLKSSNKKRYKSRTGYNTTKMSKSTIEENEL